MHPAIKIAQLGALHWSLPDQEATRAAAGNVSSIVKPVFSDYLEKLKTCSDELRMAIDDVRGWYDPKPTAWYIGWISNLMGQIAGFYRKCTSCVGTGVKVGLVIGSFGLVAYGTYRVIKWWHCVDIPIVARDIVHGIVGTKPQDPQEVMNRLVLEDTDTDLIYELKQKTMPHALQLYTKTMDPDRKAMLFAGLCRHAVQWYQENRKTLSPVIVYNRAVLAVLRAMTPDQTDALTLAFVSCEQRRKVVDFDGVHFSREADVSGAVVLGDLEAGIGMEEHEIPEGEEVPEADSGASARLPPAQQDGSKQKPVVMLDSGLTVGDVTGALGDLRELFTQLDSCRSAARGSDDPAAGGVRTKRVQGRRKKGGKVDRAEESA